MVITCPQCSACYRLPREKIQGRGAKITCPRCAHVFVVFLEDGLPSGEVPASPPPPPMPAPPALGRTGAAATLAASGGSASRPPVALPPPDPSAPPAPAPAAYAALELRAENARRPAPAPPPPAPPPSGQGGRDQGERTVDFASQTLRADRLNFREVGIQTWKVKVGIGLTYDFSDINTLRRYLDDKKVTPDDQISWDVGKSWVRIGEVGDLERYFIRIWTEARDRREAAGETASRTGRMAAMRPTGGLLEEAGRLVAEAAAAEDAEMARTTRVPSLGGRSASMPSLKANGAAGKGQGPRPVDAPDPANAYRVDLKVPARRARPTERPKRSGWGIAAILAVGLVAAGFIYFGGGANEDGVPAIPGRPERAVIRGPSQSSLDRFQSDYERRLREARAQQAASAAEVPADAAVEREAAPLVPVPIVTPQRTPTEPSERLAPLPIRRGAATVAGVQAGSSGSTHVEDVTAADYAALGQAAATGGRWGDAVQQFTLATGMEGGNATYRFQLGNALHRSARDGEAEAQLQKAVELNPSLAAAWKLLGDLADQRGDHPGAATAWQRYLAANPHAPDAATIRDKLARAGQ